MGDTEKHGRCLYDEEEHGVQKGPCTEEEDQLLNDYVSFNGNCRWNHVGCCSESSSAGSHHRLAMTSTEAFEKVSSHKVKRSEFPKDFIFGSATSAYQVEGAAHEDGKGPSIWDTFAEKFPERIKDGSNGLIACDTYHRYKEDVNIMSDIGLDAYRYSISWSRILPHGNLKGGINQKGIDYYNNLTNEVISKGLKPFVTLFHWDTPQALEDAYGGFRGAQIVNDYRDFSELCFKMFGDRVKHWITLNEPLTFIKHGYIRGDHAPGRASKFINPNCTSGDSATEPYIVAHNMLLAHAAAVKVYRQKYQVPQKGEIGITLISHWFVPYSDSYADRLAAARAMAFALDWFMEPLVNGKYPDDMIDHVKGGRLQNFSVDQSSMLKGSYDFFGINYYTSYYVQDVPCATENISIVTDRCANITGERNGVPIGPKAASDWLFISPYGIRNLLLYIKYKFKDPVIYITENGMDDHSTPDIHLKDVERIDYYGEHLKMVQEAVVMGARVKGYFAWSLLDNYEWSEGYTVRFGLVYVDYKDGQKRYLKNSAKWFKNFLMKEKHNHR